MSDVPEHSQQVKSALAHLVAERKAVLRSGMDVIRAASGRMYQLDFLVLGAAKRYVSTGAAFQQMINSWNMICARTLLRMHIDTTLRFSAAWLVQDAHKFASEILGGEQINRLKDAKGERLTDAYLVQVRSADLPWLPEVYKNLSGYVHFSGSHIFDSIAELDENERTAHFQISESDTKFPERSWFELIECFLETSSAFRAYLDGYAKTKSDAAGTPGDTP
jgi:hypothetical protein